MSVELHVETHGDGPDVVVLHGLFGAGRNWLTVARRMSERYRFHLVDLRNHGRSPHHPSMTYSDMTDDVVRLADRLGLDGYTLVGHSMGGKAAMTLALNTHEKLERLVCVDIAPVSYPDRFVEMIAAMRALDLDGIRRRNDADSALESAIPERTVRQFILQNLTFSNGQASWRANLAALADQMPYILGPLPVASDARSDIDTWFIRGEHSDRIRPEHHALIKRLFPDHRIETVGGGGHWPHAEAPGAFLDLFEIALRGA